MRTTLILDEALIDRALNLTGVHEKTALVHEELRALIALSGSNTCAAGPTAR